MTNTEITASPAAASVAIIELPTRFPQNDLVAGFMELRKRVFVDQMAWDLEHDEGVEFEQYDTFSTTYVIVHRNRSVIGGARLKRTNAINGTGVVGYSYMIRDAHLGLLPGMPPALCTNAPPVDQNVWELTRLVTVDGAAGVAETILRATNDFLRTKKAKACLFLGSPAFMRMAKKLGWRPEPLGPIVGNKDGRFLAFSCDVLDRDMMQMQANS